jgi:hypothetical protein
MGVRSARVPSQQGLTGHSRVSASSLWKVRRALGLTIVGLGACYVPAAEPPPAVTLKTRFDPAATAWSQEPGENRIEGTALLRTRGGEARTCAALDVGLIPWSKYAGERMAHLYGSIQQGFNPVYPYGRAIRWANDDPKFYQSVRSSTCDAAGHFEFEGLPDGEWYVEATVTWDVPRVRFSGGPQGGTIMRRVKLEGGETRKLVLTQ